MKTKTPNLGLAWIALTLLALSGANSAVAQSTAFTYNGRLNNNGAPVSGPHDMRFTLHSLPSGVNVVGGPLPVGMVDVVNGLFTVRIEFVENVFTGPARWLEVEVRPAGAAAFKMLTPRQEVTSSPYAIRAQTAGRVAIGAVTANQLSSGGVLPAAGQFLSYDGGKFLWRDPGVAVGNIWSALNGNAYYNGGNVGIGTSTAAAKLDVRGSLVLEAGGSPGLFTGTGNAELNRYLALINSPTSPSASGLKSGGVLVANDYSFANPGKSDLIVKGNVMIGTATPAIQTRLTIQTTPGLATSKWGVEQTDGTVRLATYVGDGGYRTGLGTRSNHPLSLFANDGDPALTISPGGNVGIGTTSPQAKLHLYDPASVTQRIETGGGVNAWAQLRFKTANGEWYAGTSRSFNNDEFYISRVGSPINAFSIPASGFEIRFATADLYLGHLSRRGLPGRALVDWVKPGTDVHQLVLNFDNAWAETVIGGSVTEVKTLRITGGADLAEPFQMKEEKLAKGSVVVIDDEHPGRLKRSRSAYDTRVAGIISGANGVNPGIALHQEGVVEGGQNVALSGRVYVQADAAFGAIKPGDLLTTSDTPGHAMKVTEHGKAQGAILGKAMSALREGKGMVLVLVTLQ